MQVKAVRVTSSEGDILFRVPIRHAARPAYVDDRSGRFIERTGVPSNQFIGAGVGLVREAEWLVTPRSVTRRGRREIHPLDPRRSLYLYFTTSVIELSHSGHSYVRRS